MVYGVWNLLSRKYLWTALKAFRGPRLNLMPEMLTWRYCCWTGHQGCSLPSFPRSRGLTFPFVFTAKWGCCLLFILFLSLFFLSILLCFLVFLCFFPPWALRVRRYKEIFYHYRCSLCSVRRVIIEDKIFTFLKVVTDLVDTILKP